MARKQSNKSPNKLRSGCLSIAGLFVVLGVGNAIINPGSLTKPRVVTPRTVVVNADNSVVKVADSEQVALSVEQVRPTRQPPLTNTPRVVTPVPDSIPPTVTSQPQVVIVTSVPTTGPIYLIVTSTFEVSSASAPIVAGVEGVTLSPSGDIANVRSGPGTDYGIVGSVRRGDILDVIERTPDNSWYLIVLPENNVSGWIFSGVVQVSGDRNLVPVNSTIQIRNAAAPVNNSGSSGSSGGGTGGSGNGSGMMTTKPAPAPVGDTCPGFNYTCSQLTCTQAYACLAAGNRQLDGDGDDKPCETKCGG